MGRFAVVGGSSTRGIEVPAGGDVIVLQRHGLDGYVLPDRIDHVANMRSLAEAGCDRVLAIGSVGGLRPEIAPGAFVCPDDFIAPASMTSAFDDQRAHRVPGFDPAWRGRLIATWKDSNAPPLLDRGVYWQTAGPRLETAAEIRMIAAHADVVGMTIASESVAAGELGLAYAAVCVVDNLANGVGARELTMGELEAGRAANRDALERALEAVIPALA